MDHHPRHERVAEPTLRSLSGRLDRGVLAVEADTTPFDALKVMAAAGQDAVAVMEDGHYLGVFSEHDLARSLLAGQQGANSVRSALSGAGLVPDPSLSLEDGLGLLDQAPAGHLPVIEDGRLVALLSRADMMAELRRHDGQVFHETGIDWKMLFWRGVYSC